MEYGGIRFQGAGLDISGGGGPRRRVVTFPDGKLQLFQEAEALWRGVWLRETSCCDAVRYLLAELSSGTVRVRGCRWHLYR
jgi:hypothetical protein